MSRLISPNVLRRSVTYHYSSTFRHHLLLELSYRPIKVREGGQLKVLDDLVT